MCTTASGRDIRRASALLWALEQGLGADFTDEVRDAWVAAYNLLSGAMIEASSEPVPEAA